MICRVRRTAEWKVRLLNELDYHKESCFITLTYRNDELSEGGNLCKSDLQKFIKRLRKKLFKLKKIKYYAVGEYGEENLRPHYHLIIFGWKPDSLYLLGFKNGKRRYASLLLDQVWPYGQNNVGVVEHDSIQYVVGYVRKKLNGKEAKKVYGDRVLPFSICSQGIGERYAQDNAEKIRKNLGVKIKGKDVGLPRYYRKKLDIEKEKLYGKSLKKSVEIVKQTIDMDDIQRLQHVRETALQKEKNLKAKVERNFK